jgi:regulator of sirC expression with transglutaminase-like and TPR domain
MGVLSKEHWGSVVSNYHELYGNHQDYTRQLRSLEKAIVAKPHDPALRFLAGFHFGYLGFLPQSIEQLEFAVQNEPRDEIAKQLLDEMKSRRNQHQSLPLVPSPVKETSWTKSR